jgi:4-amino-4-deoxy-L-arabinose transferase-like glycosyltransferase
MALAAFLVAQRAAASERERLLWMMAAWAAIAGATLTKGLVALVIPGGALFFYTLATRDFALWKRLHIAAGLTLAVAIAVPWFVAVSRANPEFAHFFFVHEHFERFLTTEHNRTGAWWYFIPLLLVGVLPWLGIWVWTLSSSWRGAVRESNGFSWPRFCLVWAAFVFVFFSASGSKLPSYILPMFPALALTLGAQLTRIAPPTLFRLTLFAAIVTALLLLAALFGYDRMAARLADARTPLAVYREAGPWMLAAVAVWLTGNVVWLALSRRATPAARTWGIAAMALASILALQCGFAASDAFRVTRSAAGLAAAIPADSSPGCDAGAPLFQLHMYDQTLPFYLQRPTTVVAFRDELALGLDAEPARGVATVAEWEERWRALPQAYAVMASDTLDKLAADGVPYRVVAREPRRVMIARH